MLIFVNNNGEGGLKVHIWFALILVACTIYTKSYKLWKKHLDTLWYVSSMVLLYHFLTPTKKLWVYSNTIFTNILATELIYIFITMPCAILIFLNSIKNKKNFRGKAITFLNMITISELWECVYVKFKFIYHLNGWNLIYSVFFYIIMYLCIWLHEEKPLIVYLLSLIVIFILMTFFKIPFLDINFDNLGGLNG
jgi:hypothetical protein